MGRPHPDPRADPPTEVLDPSGARTEELQQVGPETTRIPVSAGRGTEPAGDPDSELDTADIPVVEPGADPVGGGATGHALALSALLGALGGLVGWLVATRIMPAAAVGEAQLVVSTFLMVGALAQLSIGLVLARWAPEGRPAGRLVWGTLPLVMLLSGLVGLAYSLLGPTFAATTAGPIAPPVMGLLLFVLACAGWGVFGTHNVLLAAAGKPRWAVWRGVLFAVVQIGALVALVVLGGPAGLGAHGVVLSWAAPLVVWVVLGSIVIAALTRRIRVTAGWSAGSFSAPTAMSQVGAMLLYHQIPIVVTVRFGPETGAAFFIAWQAFVVVDLAAAYFMSSLSVSVAREPHRVAELVATARRRLLIVFLPVLALGAALAGPLVSLVGAAYAEAAHLLRLLLLGLAFRLVVTHELGVRQALGRGAGFARLQLLSTVLVLVMAIAVPVTGAGVAALLPVAIGYIVAQVACAAAMLVLPAARRTDVEVRAP